MTKGKDIWEDFYDDYNSNEIPKTYRCDDCNYKWKITIDTEFFEEENKEESDSVIYEPDVPECCPVCGSENIVEV